MKTKTTLEETRRADREICETGNSEMIEKEPDSEQIPRPEAEEVPAWTRVRASGR